MVLLVIVGFSFHQWQQYSRANTQASQITQAVESVDQVLSGLTDAETSQRGFLLTGEDRYLAPYQEAVRALADQLSAVRNRLGMRPDEARHVALLGTLATRKLAELQQAIDLRRAGSPAPATALALSDEGKRTMDAIRAVCRDIKTAEKGRQRQASIQGETAARTTLLATSVASLGLLFLFALHLAPGAEVHPRYPVRALPVRYGVAVASAAAAFLLRIALTPLIGPTELGFAMALPAVLLAGWFGGLGPGALCVLISGFASAYYFAEPVGSFLINNQTDQISFVIYLVLGFGIVYLGDSQRRAVERALRSESAEQTERQRFETTLRSIGDAVVATDADGRVTFANRVALSLLRWPEPEISGRPLDEVFRIVNEETRATVESPVAGVLGGGGIVGLANHTVLIARDGTEVPIDDSAAPLLGSGDKMQGAVLVFRDITARRHAEAASRLLASIVESSGDAIFSQDLNGIVTTWNIGAERIFGYTADEMIGKPSSVLAAPQFPDEMVQILEWVAHGERVDQYRTIRRTKSGGLIHASVSVSPVLNAAGRITGASKIIRDITVQVEAQKEVAEQRERLRVTLSSIGDAVLSTDSAGRLSYLNPVAERLTGWTNQEASGRPIEEVFRIVNEISRQTLENPAARVLREGKVVGLANHTLLIARDGTEIAIDDSAAPIRDARNEVIGVVLVFRDVTGKRATEKLMMQQAAELRQRARLMQRVVCFVRDLEDRIVYWNPGATDLYGFSEAEAVGQISHSLLHTAFPIPLDRIRARMYKSGEWDGELVHTRRNGTPFTVASHWALHHDEDGKPVSILEMNIDITDRLELLAKERALASEKALRETEAELARVLRALSVSELATSIAHEVNQPIAGVVTNAEAGLRWLGGAAPDLEEARVSLGLIARDANRASAVIRRIREFLKKEHSQTASIDLNDVVKEAVALTRGEIEKRSINLSTQLSGNLPCVRGDRIQLQQVAVNLILNAVEAMVDAPPPRDLLVTSGKTGDGGVLVAVRDSGAGIDPANLHRIFDAFFTTKPAGIGMGLSICRSIVEAHGGRIWADANQGSGLTVQFGLPAEAAAGKVYTASEAS
ncbi:MAG TPA: PAS domain S-box protein [Bryobacteraceae bacterium]|nr:PAS domain S-box protein [Bryobacteraceae bacterium]